MSHPEQLEFFRQVVALNKELLGGEPILEIGSYDVNGSIRNLFETLSYTGVDLTPGPGVDVVSFGHELDYPDGHFRATVSGECFEHDPHWAKTFQNMVRMTEPGGVVAFSCASRGRLEHGTRRTEPTASPGTQAVGSDYYRNLNESDFRGAVDIDGMFDTYRFWYVPSCFDLYFLGQKAGGSGSPVEFPDDADINELRAMTPLPYRVARSPLRLTSRLLADPAYQNFALRYWRSLSAASQLRRKLLSRPAN